MMAIAACSGAAQTDLLGPSTESQTNGTDPTTSSSSGNSSGESSSGNSSGESSSGNTSSGASGNTSSGSSGNTSSGSSGTDAGKDATPPDAGPPPCVAEVEDNDELGDATPFATRFCGKIDARTDVDFGEIQLPPNTSSFSYKWTSSQGNVSVRIYAGAVPIPFDGNTEIKVLAGTTYSVRVTLSNSGSSSARPTYEVDIASK